MGSYACQIKSSEWSSNHDIPATLQALLETGQNLYGVACDDGTAWDNETGFYWTNLVEILQATQDTDIKIVAVVGERHHIASTNRWGLTATSTSAAAIVAWIEAAKELSHLSSQYPRLIAFSIDDFSGYVSAIDPLNCLVQPYTPAQVRSIAEAAKVFHPTFKFWPTVYYTDAVRILSPGYVLGSPYGVWMYSDEYASVDLAFSLDAAPSAAEVSFFYADSFTGDSSIADAVRKRVEVNGTALFDASIRGDAYVERYAGDVAFLLGAGTNRIRIKLYTTTGVTAYHSKVFTLGDLRLRVDGHDVSFSATYDKHESPVPYIDPWGSTIDNVGRILAESNAARLIADRVDGMFVPFNNVQFADAPHDELLSSAKRALGTRDLVSVLYATYYGTTLDAARLRQWMRKAADAADGLLLWNYAMPIHFLDERKGIFAQRASQTPGYDLVAFWPMYQLGVEGWYQQWTSKSPLSGPITLLITDSFTAESSTQYFRKRMLDAATGEVLYSDGIEGNEGSQSIGIDLGSTPRTIVLRVEMTAGVGNFSAAVWMRLLDSSGTPRGKESWTFAGGADAQNVTDLYAAATAEFRALREAMERPY